MAQTEAETGRVEMEKQFDGLKLEVHRINRFLEHENLVNPQSKMGIFSSAEPTSISLSSSAVVGGSHGHCINPPHQDHELALAFLNPRI
jgi:hypothetical protein